MNALDTEQIDKRLVVAEKRKMKPIRFQLYYALLLVALLANMSCTSDTLPDSDLPWTGETITFTKIDGADPDDPANQDRITDNVWITRGNNGGQIYNAKVENAARKRFSPEGTQWAVGILDEVDDLQFSDFRDAVGSPQNVVGRNLVMFLEADSIYIGLRFTSWSQQKQGGFAYIRSTR